MLSDPKRVREVRDHIERIKQGTYSKITGPRLPTLGGLKVVEQPWAEVSEPNKLTILQSSLDFSGITSGDRALMLLAQVDGTKLTDTQRQRLIREAVGEEPPPPRSA